jgi:hypothetical protein
MIRRISGREEKGDFKPAEKENFQSGVHNLLRMMSKYTQCLVPCQNRYLEEERGSATPFLQISSLRIRLWGDGSAILWPLEKEVGDGYGSTPSPDEIGDEIGD